VDEGVGEGEGEGEGGLGAEGELDRPDDGPPVPRSATKT
jgi:hypothetical protein